MEASPRSVTTSLLGQRERLNKLAAQLDPGGLLEIEHSPQQQGAESMGSLLIEMAGQHKAVTFQQATLSCLSMGAEVQQDTFDGLGIDFLDVGGRGIHSDKGVPGSFRLKLSLA